MIKIITLILVIVILIITICYFTYFSKTPEEFTVCKDFKSVPITLHNIDFEYELNEKSLNNYITNEFFNKILLKPMNSIFKPLKINFYLSKIITEETSKNLAAHYEQIAKSVGKSHASSKKKEAPDNTLLFDFIDQVKNKRRSTSDNTNTQQNLQLTPAAALQASLAAQISRLSSVPGAVSPSGPFPPGGPFAVGGTVDPPRFTESVVGCPIQETVPTSSLSLDNPDLQLTGLPKLLDDVNLSSLDFDDVSLDLLKFDEGNKRTVDEIKVAIRQNLNNPSQIPESSISTLAQSIHDYVPEELQPINLREEPEEELKTVKFYNKDKPTSATESFNYSVGCYELGFDDREIINNVRAIDIKGPFEVSLYRTRNLTGRKIVLQEGLYNFEDLKKFGIDEVNNIKSFQIKELKGVKVYGSYDMKKWEGEYSLGPNKEEKIYMNNEFEKLGGVVEEGSKAILVLKGHVAEVEMENEGNVQKLTLYPGIYEFKNSSYEKTYGHCTSSDNTNLNTRIGWRPHHDPYWGNKVVVNRKPYDRNFYTNEANIQRCVEECEYDPNCSAAEVVWGIYSAGCYKHTSTNIKRGCAYNYKFCFVKDNSDEGNKILGLKVRKQRDDEINAVSDVNSRDSFLLNINDNTIGITPDNEPDFITLPASLSRRDRGGRDGDGLGEGTGRDRVVNFDDLDDSVKSSAEELDKFVRYDLQLIKKLMNKKFNYNGLKTYINLLINIFDDTLYNNNNLHIFLLPVLPNNEKIIITEGTNKKPLILLSLHNSNTLQKSIQSFDSSIIDGNFIDIYVSNKKQLENYEKELDMLINGNTNAIKELRDNLNKAEQKLNDFNAKNKNLEEIIRKYNCAQNHLMELYSKDYMKHSEILKLKKFKKTNNYKNLVTDKVNELKAVDNKKIESLEKESKILKKQIDESNEGSDPLFDNIEEIKKRLNAYYSGSINSEKISFIKKNISKLKLKINKYSTIVRKLNTSIMLSKYFALLNGVSITHNNNNFDIMNNIKNNGTVITGQTKKNLHTNIYNHKFLNFDKSIVRSSIKNIIPYFPGFINKKCGLDDKVSNICRRSINFFYQDIPKLELVEQIAILRDIVTNIDNYSYLTDIDYEYLRKLLKFLEKTHFGEDYHSEESLANKKLDEDYFVEDIFEREEAVDILKNIIDDVFINTGRLNINSELVNRYNDIKNKQNRYDGINKYYKSEENRNVLSPPKRVYKAPKEAINCPSEPEREYIKDDNTILDDHMMKPINCKLPNYVNSFEDSFI